MSKNDKNAWIGEKILAQEDKLMEQLAKTHFDKLDGKEPDTPPPPAPEAQDLPVDPAVERQAYADLLAHFAENPEDDCEVTMLTAEEFAEDTFTPATDETQENMQ